MSSDPPSPSEKPASPVSTPAPSTRAGFVALIGEPNAGKSTLLNRMVGAKVSIVTHKVQTTRARIRGIVIDGDSQVVFVDTPGLFRPKRALDRAMVAAAWTSAADADLVVVLAEAHRGMTEGVAQILDDLSARMSGKDAEPPSEPAAGAARGAPRAALAINKIDRVKRESLLAVAAQLSERFSFDRVFMISAEKGDGVEDLKHWLADSMPEGPWLYPADDISDLPLRMLAAEITREKLTLRLHQELPYQLTVETEAWEDRSDGSTRIDQVIFVARDGHKGIVLGHRGETIKEIGRLARTEIAALIERPAHVFLRVAVRPNWATDPERLRAIGLEPPDRGR